MAPDRGILDISSLPPGRTESYGPQPHQVYEMFERTDSPTRALIVLVHGGFWRAEWDRSHLRPLAHALAGQGYAVALIEYARSGVPGGGWPMTGQDCAAALAHVREREGVRGRGSDNGAGSELPVLLVGHSAGGHLAVWLLHQAAARGVVGAVSLAGCLDLHLTHRLGLGDDAAAALMGSVPTLEPSVWEGADPSRLGRTAYPVAVMHGSADEQVPLEVAESWWQAAGTPGRDRLIVIEGGTHFPLIDPDAAEHDVVSSALSELLQAH